LKWTRGSIVILQLAKREGLEDKRSWEPNKQQRERARLPDKPYVKAMVNMVIGKVAGGANWQELRKGFPELSPIFAFLFLLQFVNITLFVVAGREQRRQLWSLEGRRLRQGKRQLLNKPPRGYEK
jgi:hypothetical protein